MWGIGVMGGLAMEASQTWMPVQRFPRVLRLAWERQVRSKNPRIGGPRRKTIRVSRLFFRRWVCCLRVSSEPVVCQPCLAGWYHPSRELDIVLRDRPQRVNRLVWANWLSRTRRGTADLTVSWRRRLQSLMCPAKTRGVCIRYSEGFGGAACRRDRCAKCFWPRRLGRFFDTKLVICMKGFGLGSDNQDRIARNAIRWMDCEIGNDQLSSSDG